MHEFSISIRSFQEVQDFVALASVQPFRIFVANQVTQVNAKSYMGMFSLDFRRPLTVLADCSEEAFLKFRQQAAHFSISE